MRRIVIASLLSSACFGPHPEPQSIAQAGIGPGSPPAAAAVLPHVEPTAPKGAEVAPVAKPVAVRELRVATYNILSGELGLDGVIAAIRALDADVIALQEIDVRTRRGRRVDQPAVIAKALGMEVAFVEHRRVEGGRTGVALLARDRIANIERIPLPGGVLAALHAEVMLPAGAVHVFVVHLHPTDLRDPRSEQARMDVTRQREADTVLVRATEARRPTLVLGDFNALSNGPEYSLFADHFEDACPKGEPTWPASQPSARIDYVWLSRHFEAIACPSVTPAASDHHPVVVDLARTPEQ